MSSPTVFDHLRPTDDDYPDGVYRVVGTAEESVTLLRVGDADGRRVTTGDVVTVDREDLSRFDAAENPDGRRSPGAAVTALVEAVYWSVRTFFGQLAAHPLATAVTVALVVVGAVGDGLAGVPAVASDLFVLVGVLGLAYVGSGRL